LDLDKVTKSSTEVGGVVVSCAVDKDDPTTQTNKQLKEVKKVCHATPNIH